jgi:hypothetical protein
VDNASVGGVVTGLPNAASFLPFLSDGVGECFMRPNNRLIFLFNSNCQKLENGVFDELSVFKLGFFYIVPYSGMNLFC